MALPDAIHSALDPHSPEAAAIARMAAVLFASATVIFIVVMLLALVALRRRPAWLARDSTVILGGIAFPVVVLTALLVYAARVSPVTPEGEPLRIRVVGQQWWWRVHYLDGAGAVEFETANEIRLPVGRRVDLMLESADVLHSFWVPSLAGKLDMIPGRVNRLALTASSEGTFRGQCAEYCGGPHARMGLYVVTMADAAFERWRVRQRAPAASTNAVFEARCASCHTVRGTPAAGTLGPDLTHVAGRVSLGAATLPAGEAALREWIVGNQHVKPGNLMPAFGDLGDDGLARLAAYLESLE